MNEPAFRAGDAHDALALRLGEALLDRRLDLQHSQTAELQHQGEGLMRIERILPMDDIIAAALRWVGMAGIARRNCLDIVVERVEWTFRKLPEEFDGLRILHLTDLHIDLIPELADILAAKARHIPHDVAVITGDFRNFTDGDYEKCIPLCDQIIQELAPDRFGILGNHDFIEMVPHLEAAGLPVLLNECAVIQRGDAQLQIAGIDDSHFYKTHALDMAGRRKDLFTVLLAHSPEIHADIAAAGYDFALCGHTHGGQMCLPGGFHVVCPVKNLSRNFIRGAWSSGALRGYTSRGSGSCGVAARFFCPPEITLHTLHAVPNQRNEE